MLVVAVIIITFAYRRTDKPLSRRLRAILIALRAASVCLLLICLLEPTLTAREEVHRKANLLILVDDSQSMSVTDPNESVARIDAVKETLAPGENSLMTGLADRFNVQLYQFDSDCTDVEELNPTAEGTLTDIGKALSRAVSDSRGQLTAGIILISDGGNNSGGNPLEIARQTNVPIHTVGVGSTEKPRDIQVAKVEVSPIAYVDHLLPVRAVIKSSGYDGQEVRVSLIQGVEQTQDTPLLDSVSLTLDGQLGEQSVDLQLKLQQEGTFNFSVTVPAEPEEFTDQNNEYPFFIKSVKEKLKVLYVDGRPRWEYAFLKRALQRDPNIEAKCLVAMKGDHIDAPLWDGAASTYFPAAKRDLFSYDVLILGDMDLGFFSSEQLSIVNDFIEDKGGSVIFLGGKHSLGTDGFGGSALSGMLPIEIGPGGARQVKSAFSPVLTQDGLRHPVTRFGGAQAENTAIWRDLPALTQFYEGTGVKLGATILAEHQRVGANSRPRPVIALQRYGKGTAIMISSDSLWRWAFGAYPFGGDDSHYRRFWSRTIRWLASIHTEADLVNIETNKGSYHRDEKVRVTAYIYDESYTPVDNAELRSQVQIPGSPTETGGIDLKFAADGNGRYTAEFTPGRDGHYKIQTEAYHAGRLLGESSAEFMVQTTALEFRDTQLKEDLLRDLADVSGGSYRHLRNTSDLSSAIKEVSDSYVSIRERRLWDNAIMLMLAVALLGTEWLIRKRKGLV